MGDRDYFAEPKDVTTEYKKRVKSLPRAFVVVTLAWVSISLFTVVFGTGWQLFCTLVLVAIILYFGNKMSGDRKMIAKALKRGAINRRLMMSDQSIELIDELADDNTVVLDRTAVSLKGLVDVRVAKDWIGIYGTDPEFCSLDLRNDQFRDSAARSAFIDELLVRLDSDGKTREHSEPYNPWIGKL